MSEAIRVTSPDGAVSIMGSATRTFFERKNARLAGLKRNDGSRPKLYIIEDYEGPTALELPSVAAAKKKSGK